MALAELKKTPGAVAPAADGFTPEQRLYLGFAQVWCENQTEASRRLHAQTDPHSAARWRVMGPLSNTPDFGRAFACKSGEPLLPAKTCRVW